MARYVIGDIHGCAKEFICLVEALPLEPDDLVVFLGDYVDRGPDSKGVISYLIEWRQRALQRLVFLKGNHEDMFLSYLGLPGSYGEMFLFNGGGQTLASYGIPRVAEAREATRARIPERHLEFLQDLTIHHVLEPFFCVHGGIHPAKSLAEQTEEEMLWIRDEFILNRHLLPYTVLFGHTPQREVLFDLPYKIGLDTGLVYGNKLSCLEVDEKVLFQIGRGQRRITRTRVKDSWEQISHAPGP
jgi:serine/threonine protein phosphatase 1